MPGGFATVGSVAVQPPNQSNQNFSKHAQFGWVLEPCQAGAVRSVGATLERTHTHMHDLSPKEHACLQAQW